METPIRILVVDDHEPWRRFIRSMLENEANLQVIGEASDGLQAIQQARKLRPDLVLLDIGLPTLNGIEAAKRISKLSPKTKIIIVSENRSSDIIGAALSMGARGYVVKSDGGTKLLSAIKAVLEGKRFLSEKLGLNVSGAV